MSDRPLLLLDKSAWVRGAAAADQEGELCLCAVTRMEILSSARSATDCELLEEDLAAFRDLRIDTATVDAAVGAQRQAAAAGEHPVPIPDLIVAACAERHAADVLHVDRHYDLLARYLNFKPVRLVS